jgi:hypothetical protein
MGSQHDRVRQCVKLSVLGLVVLLAGLGGAALAQEDQALMSVELPATSADEPIEQGGEDFEVNIAVDNVTNLAAFQFMLEYDSSVIEYVSVEESPFLGSSGREVMCPDPWTEPGVLGFSCSTLGPPVSVGGVAGPDGSGVVATITFSPIGGGETPLNLIEEESKLLAAEIDEEGMAVKIETALQSSSLEVGSSGGFAWMLWGPIIGVVAAIIVIGLAYLVVRMRGAQEAGPPASP